jgi:hypothetical protein
MLVSLHQFPHVKFGAEDHERQPPAQKRSAGVKRLSNQRSPNLLLNPSDMLLSPITRSLHIEFIRNVVLGA